MAKRGTTETPEVTAEKAASDVVTEQTNIPDEGTENKTPEVTAEKAASERSDVPQYSKEKLLKSNWHSHRRDILNVILQDDKQYSHADVDKLIADFMKGKVK
jgi:hypothetical protein